MAIKEIITKLTPKQEELKDSCRMEYMDIGWNTEPVDHAVAEVGMAVIYKNRLKRKVPQFIWFDSPAAAKKVMEENGVTDFTPGVRGGIEAYWLCRFSFVAKIVPGVYLEDDEKYRQEIDHLMRNCGFIYPFAHYCLMCERPTVLNRNERDVLHCENGPAIAYKDGNEKWFFDGIEVTQQIIEAPHTMTLAQIEAMSDNTDVQTIAQERWCHGDGSGVGGGRWLEETGAETIDMDSYTAYEDVSIMRALVKDKLGRKYLVCTDSSTDRVYYIRSGDDVTTCREAHKSFNGGIDDADIVCSA